MNLPELNVELFSEKKRMRGLAALLEHKTGINRILEPNPHSIINSKFHLVYQFLSLKLMSTQLWN